MKRIRKTGIMKREPAYFYQREDHIRFARLSKADWADAYVDLYGQVFGADSVFSAILADAEHRIKNLKRQGIVA
jgi:hypothetical protein